MRLGQGSIASTDSMQNCLEGSHQIDSDHLYWNILNRCDWVGRYPGSGTYTPIVDAIIDTQSRDVRQIEHTLDGLLVFCFDSEALVLYKKLRRHYLSIDPVTTVEYVNAYREMWGPEKGNGTLNAASTKMT
jgi:hypothetical protein